MRPFVGEAFEKPVGADGQSCGTDRARPPVHRRDRNRPNVVDHVVAVVFAAAAAVDDRRQGRRQRNPSVRSSAADAAATAADATDAAAAAAADEFHGHPNAVGRSPPGPMGRLRVRRPDRSRTGARGHGPDAVPERRQARRERQAGPPTDVAARLGPVRRRVRVRRRRRAPVRRRRRGRGHVARLARRTDPGPGRQRVRLGRDAEKSKVGKTPQTEWRARDLARPPLTGLSRRTSRKNYSKPNVFVDNVGGSRTSAEPTVKF